MDISKIFISNFILNNMLFIEWLIIFNKIQIK